MSVTRLTTTAKPNVDQTSSRRFILGPGGKPLAPALNANEKSLPFEARLEVQKLNRPAPWRFLMEAMLAWAVILGMITLAVTLKNVWVSITAILLIATRQNVLGLLVHEQAHYLGFRSKFGDILTDFLAGFPLLISVEGYSKIHLAHHKFYFTEKDPDFIRKQGINWTFPMRLKLFLKLLLSDLSGFSSPHNIIHKNLKTSSLGPRKTSSPSALKWSFYAVLGLSLTMTQTWGIFLLYWILPLVTILQVIVRFGAICEHKYNLLNPSVVESTPIIVLRWWEKLLLPNLNFTLHIYHHFYPGIPFSKLPKVHHLFEKAGLVNQENIYRGYGAYLKSLLWETSPEVSR